MREHNIYFSFHSEIEYNNTIDLITLYFDNFSIIDVLGYYKGKSEISKCLRIIDLHVKTYDLTFLVKEIKKICNQECVLYTINEIKAKLI